MAAYPEYAAVVRMTTTYLSDEVLASLAGADIEEILKEIDGMKDAIKAKKSVDEWLNEVDYSDDPNYVPSEFALNYLNFMKLCNGVDGSDNLTPIVHYKVLDTFALKTDRVANLMFRGFGKTTLIQYLFPYIAVMRDFPGLGAIDFAIYVSDSIDNGVASFKDSMEDLWKKSAYLQVMLPERIDGKEVTYFNATKWVLTNKKGETLIVRGYGVKTGIRGVKSKGKRPQLGVIDDVISDDDASSDVLIKKINNTIDKAVTHAMDTNKRKLIWLGTPFNAKDPLYTAVESGAWSVNLFPVAEVFPCSRANFKGAWEDRFTYDFLLREYLVAAQSGKVSAFNQELMLRIMGDGDRLLPDEEIVWYDTVTRIMDNMDAFNFYITTDFAISEKQHANLSAISVWAVNNKGTIFWVDGKVSKQTMDKNIDDLFMFAKKYRPMGVGVEASGQQKAFIAWIRKEMQKRDEYFPFAVNLSNKRAGSTSGSTESAGVFSTKDKIAAFNVVLPLWKSGNIRLPKDLKEKHPALSELIDEISKISPSGIRSRYDDMLDTVNMLGKIQIQAASYAEESYNAYVGYQSIDDIFGSFEPSDQDYYDEGSSLGSYIV